MWYATQARDAYPYYQHTAIGYNYRMSNVCAGIGRGQMTVLDSRIKHHQHVRKLYEELLTPSERNAMRRTDHDRIMIAPAVQQDAELFEMQLQTLQIACEHNDERVVEVIRAVVPSFQPQEHGKTAKAVG